ncbi:MAG: glucosidase [Candidatus Bipolaricaulia bacterium]
MTPTEEHERLRQYRDRESNWKHWGPYLSERAWGTVREDYSPHGTAWDHFPHDHARSRTYRWNEDGLLGISDRHQYLCFAPAFWNGQDPILKERLFGLSGEEGNHGEDVKEGYFYLDNTPTHSYMQALYKYPQAQFPYEELVAENGRRSAAEEEYELIDTGIFDENRYFDVWVTYAKADQDDLLIELQVTNRGPDEAPLWVLPTLWFRNTWSWGYPDGPMGDVPERPIMQATGADSDRAAIEAVHPALGTYRLWADGADGLVFTENDTNQERLFGTSNPTPYVKDAFHRYLIDGDPDAVNPARAGTKAAALTRWSLEPGETRTLRLRLSNVEHASPFGDVDDTLAQRRTEADAFYDALQPNGLSDDDRNIQRQAYAGMLWSKQLYYYDVEQWLTGDPGQPDPPPERRHGRNAEWTHLTNFDVISMPDKWEYPWYAAWDLAFHCIPLARLDPDFAKRQLELVTREWYMHPNGQLPAYEWAFDDVNPPVHPWAAWHVYRIDAELNGTPDRAFLEGVFHKLLLNFTWWVNRKDADGRNVFQGGFLGLDNISLFDRSAELPAGGHLDQSDGTAWMGFFSLEMMKIALELAKAEPVYQDAATKFFEHFLRIADAMTNCGGRGHALWDETDGFFYDALHLPDDSIRSLPVRSLVGLIPLVATEAIEPATLEALPTFRRRMEWFIEHRPHLTGNMARIDGPGEGERVLFSFLTPERLQRLLGYLLDPSEFLSPYGVRSLSKAHEAEPVEMTVDGETFRIDYQPAESRSGLFGGNSNWRGPVWFPINYLLIEALREFARYYGERIQVECPTGSGRWLNLDHVADELSERLVSLFRRDDVGRRPVDGARSIQWDPHWRELIPFHEYFHGDHGAGLGASHQTGWTGVVAELLQS